MPDIVIPNPPDSSILYQYLDCNYDALESYLRDYLVGAAVPPMTCKLKDVGDSTLYPKGVGDEVYIVDVDVQGVRDYLNVPEDKATRLARVLLDVVNHITSQEIDDVRDRLEDELTDLIPTSMLIIMGEP
jgi:hypothetical protein